MQFSEIPPRPRKFSDLAASVLLMDVVFHRERARARARGPLAFSYEPF